MKDIASRAGKIFLHTDMLTSFSIFMSQRAENAFSL